jgi:small GTP-binding protein
MKKKEEEQEIKIILVGEPFTGKTSLINTAIGLKFQENKELSTAAANFVTKEFKINGKAYIANLWDTIGQEKFRSLTKIFIKDSKIVVFVFDITDKKTFEELNFWMNTIEDILGKEAILGIAANKQDLYNQEQVKEEEIKKLSDEKNIPYKYTTAKNPQLFVSFLEELLQIYLDKCGGNVGGKSGNKLEKGKNGKKRKCC